MSRSWHDWHQYCQLTPLKRCLGCETWLTHLHCLAFVVPLPQRVGQTYQRTRATQTAKVGPAQEQHMTGGVRSCKLVHHDRGDATCVAQMLAAIILFFDLQQCTTMGDPTAGNSGICPANGVHACGAHSSCQAQLKAQCF